MSFPLCNVDSAEIMAKKWKQRVRSADRAISRKAAPLSLRLKVRRRHSMQRNKPLSRPRMRILASLSPKICDTSHEKALPMVGQGADGWAGSSGGGSDAAGGRTDGRMTGRRGGGSAACYVFGATPGLSATDRQARAGTFPGFGAPSARCSVADDDTSRTAHGTS
jgi:hypothetical protein